MSRSPLLFVRDIADRCERIRRLTIGREFADFVADDALHEAVLRHLTIIGEAVKNLPVTLLREAPEIPWREIARLRDLLVHVYFGVKDEIIWRIVNDDIAALEAVTERWLRELGSGESSEQSD